MKLIPLFGTGMRSYSRVVTSQRRLNCFYDIRKDGDKANIIVRGTPGYFVFTQIPENPIRGWRVVDSLLYVVAGSSLYQVDFGGNTTQLGAVPTTGQLVSMYDDSVNLVIVDGVTGYSATLPSGAPVLITDTAFPYGTQSITNLDSRFIAPQPGTRSFSVSGQLTGLVWTPTIFGTKENYSSKLIAVDVLNGSLILWGGTDLEWWQDVGASPNPYQRINGATQTWGLAALYSRAYIGNTMIFLGQNPQGGVQVLKFNGYSPERVSDTDLEHIISRFVIHSDAVALTYMADGHPMYQLTFPNAGRSFLYDDSTGFWYETQTGVSSIPVRHAGELGIVFNAKNYICDSTTGNIYQLDTNTYTENGSLIKRQAISRHIRMDGNEFSISEMTLEMETGVGLTTGQGSDPQIMMRVSKDGGRTFGPEIWRKLGKLGQYQRRVMWDSMGESRDFVFEWTMTDPTKFIITNGQAVVSPGVESQQ